MTFYEKSLIFQDFLFVAKFCENNSLEVDVRQLEKPTEPDKDPKWLNYEKISLQLQLPKSSTKTEKKINSVLLFENVEDTSSCITRPTLLFYPRNQPKKQSFAFILVLVQEKLNTDQNNVKFQWALKAIKKLKTSVDDSSQNIVFLDQFSFLHTKNGKLLFCDGDKEHLCLETSETADIKIENIVCISSKATKGKSFVIGVYSVKDESDISDDTDALYKLFALKKSKSLGEEPLFETLDPSLFLSEDYASCILSIYIHNFEETSQRTYKLAFEEYSKKYESDIFVIVSHGYLLEFVCGELLLSMSLVSVFRDLDLLNCDNPCKVFSLTHIKGVIESDRDRKILIFQHEEFCIAVDTKTEQVVEHWKDVEAILIGDVLCKGYDQLLLIFQPLETDIELLHWYLTDFNTVYIDYIHDQLEDRPSREDTNYSVTARNALQQQLPRMNLSVEHAEKKLKEKEEFIQNNLSKLHSQGSSPMSFKQEQLLNEDSQSSTEDKISKDKYILEIKEKWHQVLNDYLIIGICVVNQSSRSISGLTLSISCRESTNIFKTFSNQQKRSSIFSENSSARTSKSLEDQILKKIKLSNQSSEFSDGVLTPNNETIVTGSIELNQLSEVDQGQVTLSVCLHYCICEKQSGNLKSENISSCIQNYGSMIFKLKDLMDNSFTELILSDTPLTEASGNQMYHGLLCLNTIHKCYNLTLETKYGYINLISDWLNRVPGLVYKENFKCYMYTLPGALYLTRLEVTLLSDFKQVTAKVYARYENQLRLFIKLISSYLPDNIIYTQSASSGHKSLVQKFLNFASEEIKAGHELSNLFNKPVKKEDILEVNFKNQENVFKFRTAFEDEKKVLGSSDNVPLSMERLQTAQRELRNCEMETDAAVAGATVKQKNSEFL